MHPIIERYYLITIKALGIIFKLVFIDQLTKWWLINYLKHYPAQAIKVNDFLNFVYVWNYGVSFGLFNEYSHYANKFFVLFNLIIIIYLFYLILISKTISAFLAYTLIVSGAVGNLYDRIVRGAVFDFIDLHFGTYHFAIFNIADSFITLGALVIIYDFYKSKKDENLDPIKIEGDRIRTIESLSINNKKGKL